jgi:hypothetical protein
MPIKTMILSLVLLGGALHADAFVVQAGRSVITVDPYSDRRRAVYDDRAYNWRYRQNYIVQRYDNYGPESYYYYYNDSPRREYPYYYRPPIVYKQFYNYPNARYHRHHR